MRGGSSASSRRNDEDRFALTEEIGNARMSMFYIARDKWNKNREAVVKILNPVHSGPTTLEASPSNLPVGEQLHAFSATK